MIPTEKQAIQLWDKYGLPEGKRRHVGLVAKVAMFLARRCQMLQNDCQINEPLLLAGALLHDIDKNIPKLPGERHPDTAVRILKQEGMEEVADIVKTHSLHAILDPSISPKSWEEKLLYLADKMVKHEIIGVDERFRLWREEHLAQKAQEILKKSYPRVKMLLQEIAKKAGSKPDELHQKIMVV